jgi:DNA helicase II / ATP-dependent DNA helicase PcrA
MLNAQQQKAVRAVKGRVLILAGAGSGKTTVLAHRTAHLIEDVAVSPSSILGLTFTNKAAEEMRQRVASLVGLKRAKQVTLSTFHSFCMQVLRREIHHLGYTHQFSLYDERDVKRLVTNLARHLLEHEGELPSMEQTLEKIASARQQGTFHKVEEGASWHDAFTGELLERLQTCMRAYNAVDFDTLLSLTVQLFKEFPEVLNSYQTRFLYIMIDEYQDTNPVQLQLASLLSERHHNLCVVGDDDQSIYGWRGAEIRHILDFEATTLVKLEQNYRSTPIILEASHGVISHNKERHSKQLWSHQERGEKLSLFHAPTELEEAEAVIARAIWLHRHKKLPWREMAILYRSNVLVRPFEEALIRAVWEEEGRWRRGIPYHIFGGTEIYERSEIKDIMAYLRLIANPLDEEALLRIVNVPRRGISDQTLDRLTQMNRTENLPLWELLKRASLSSSFLDLSTRALKGIREFVTIIEEGVSRFQRGSLGEAFSWLLDEINYKKAIQEEVKSEKMRAFKWENVTYCLDLLVHYAEEAESPSLHDFLATTLLDREKFTKGKKENEDHIHLMTFHSAKGLEFTACFLVGIEGHLIPHEKSLQEGGIEEERRLMYVAMTRAKRYLTLSMALQRKRMGKEAASHPSPFLFEIPKELLNVTSWKHHSY